MHHRSAKPYLSSANYMNKMRNYCQGCYYDHKKRVEEKACRFHSLYWDFYRRHREKLQKNLQIGFVHKTWDGMGKNQQQDISQQAKYYRENLNAW